MLAGHVRTLHHGLASQLHGEGDIEVERLVNVSIMVVCDASATVGYDRRR